MTGSPRLPLRFALATVAVIAALLVPAAKGRSPAPAAAGPGPQLTEVWPGARTAVMPGLLKDGSAYLPLLFIDLTSSVGLATAPDADGGAAVHLVVVTGSDTRRLRSYGGSQGFSVAGSVATGGEIFWLETGQDARGRTLTTLWGAGLTSGSPRLLAQDSSNVVVVGSHFDLVLAEGQFHWIAATEGDDTELRSVPMEGGRVAERPLPGHYTLTTWPWVGTSGTGLPGAGRLLNLQTQQVVEVAAGDDQILTCTPAWCRTTTILNGGMEVEHGLRRPDGSQYRALSRDDRYPVNSDVTILDRFEVLGRAATKARAPDELWLLDLEADRSVLLSTSYSRQFGTRDGYLWWATGDSEAMVWHVLDARTLS